LARLRRVARRLATHPLNDGQPQTRQGRWGNARFAEFFLVLDGTFERAADGGTASTGDRHEGDIPDHVDSTTGHALG
jgi:hypothetical protein